MKRNNDFIREILFYVEDQPAGKIIYRIPPMEGHSPEETEAHWLLVDEAGFLQGNRNRINGGAHISTAYIFGLSNSGHDFLDSVRDPKIWDETKSKASAVGGVALDILKAIAVAIVKAQLGLS